MPIEVVYADTDLLKPSEYNPRKFSKREKEQLKESIKKFGLVDPLIVNCNEKRKNIIIGGHFRWLVAKELGIKKVPVVYVDIGDEELERELNLRLNKNTGQWDWDLLSNFDEDLLKRVGFTTGDIFRIFKLSIYTRKIPRISIIYKPAGERVGVRDLYNDTEALELLDRIEKLDVDEEIKRFLRYAAYRFVVFNYRNIAEFYSKLDNEELKEIFRDLALVIVDWDKAIERAWAEYIAGIEEAVEDAGDEK